MTQKQKSNLLLFDMYIIGLNIWSFFINDEYSVMDEEIMTVTIMWLPFFNKWLNELFY